MTRRTSEVKTLGKYRVAFENAANQPQIASSVALYGHDADKMAEGKALFDNAVLLFDTNKTENDEASAAYSVYKNKRKELKTMYARHRKKAKVAFMRDPVTADLIGVTGEMPEAYANWLQTVKKFYTTALADSNIQSRLNQFQITTEELNAGDAIIPEVEKLRAAYLKELGESQDATVAKDSALAKIDDWMREFYAVAHLALENNPQLLEALGITVKR